MLHEAFSVLSWFFGLAGLFLAIGLFLELRRVLVGKERAQVNFGAALVAVSLVLLVVAVLIENWWKMDTWWIVQLADVAYSAGVAFFLLGVLRFVMQVRRGTGRKHSRQHERAEAGELSRELPHS